MHRSILPVLLACVIGSVAAADEFATLRKTPVVTRPGTAVPLSLGVAASAGRPYLLACSLGVSTGFRLPDNRIFPLDADALFWMSLAQNNPTFTRFIGMLDQAGTASASLTIGASPQLIGLSIHPGGITSIGGGRLIILNHLKIVIAP